ncbi:hypothetical protein CVT30_33860 [Streptomyces sp. AMCC400023]|nr:hypothetical protein CVT30_33860 [Streptomyces sp. AMCC400023]
MPARFSFTSTSTAIVTTTAPAVTYARYRHPTYTASPTTAADGPVSTTRASDAGRPSRGTSGPSATPTRAYSVPARVARYAIARVRRRPREISAMPKTISICASAPHTGRSSAGTKRESGVRANAVQSGSSARTAPAFSTSR